MEDFLIFIIGVVITGLVFTFLIQPKEKVTINIPPDFIQPSFNIEAPLIKEVRREVGWVVFDFDNDKILFGGSVFNNSKEASEAAERWIRIHSDKYNDKSVIQTFVVIK